MPTGPTDALTTRVAQHVREAAFFDTACTLESVHPSVGWEWLLRGRAAQSEGNDGPEEAPFVRFAAAVDGALGTFEKLAIGAILTHAKDDWRAAAWVVKTKFPERFMPAAPSHRPELTETFEVTVPARGGVEPGEPPRFSQTTLDRLVKTDSAKLDKRTKGIQREARLSKVDRWLRAGLRESSVVRLACFHFGVADKTARDLIKAVYREWADGALVADGMSMEERRHRDRLKIEHVYSLALEDRDLSSALRALELLGKVNGTIAPDRTTINIGGPLPPEILALRSMSEEDLLRLARPEQRVIDVEPAPETA